MINVFLAEKQAGRPSAWLACLKVISEGLTLESKFGFRVSAEIFRMKKMTLKQFSWRLDIAGQRLNRDLDIAFKFFCEDAHLALRRFCEDLELSAERFCREIGRAKYASNRNLEEGMELFKTKQARIVKLFCSELDQAIANLRKATSRVLDQFNKDIGRSLETLLDETAFKDTKNFRQET